MIIMEVQFMFPGEGAIVNGMIVTPDMPIDESQLEYIVGHPAYRKRLAREKDME